MVSARYKKSKAPASTKVVNEYSPMQLIEKRLNGVQVLTFYYLIRYIVIQPHCKGTPSEIYTHRLL